MTVLGHVVRGGRLSAFDRLLGSRLANVAVRALLGGASHRMAAWMPAAGLAPDIAARSPVDPCCWLVGLGAVLAKTDRCCRPEPAGALARWCAGAFAEIGDARLL